LTNWHPEALVISILGAVCYFRSAGWKETRKERRRKSSYEILMNGLLDAGLVLSFS
jgi:hypothetical protein